MRHGVCALIIGASIFPALTALSASDALTEPTVDALSKTKATPSSNANAQETAENENSAPLENAVPPGFEGLEDKTHASILSVFYNNQQITDVSALFSSKEVLINNPQKLMHAINQATPLKKTGVFSNALSEPLPAHVNLVCAKKRYPVCQAPSVNTIAVVLNQDQFRLDIFVNADFMIRKAQETVSPILPPSTAGLSFVNEFNLLANGTVGQGKLADNYTNRGTLANADARINYDTSYVTTDANEQSNFLISTLNTEYDRGRYTATLGITQTQSTAFAPNEPFVGGHYGSNDQLIDPYITDLYAEPFSLFLKNPSRVNFFREGRLIATRFLPAGQQLIDTAQFPSGAYDLTIKIEDDFGGTSTQSHYFTKSSRLPPLDYPNYYVNLGYLMNENATANVFYPTTTVGVLQAGFDRYAGALGGIQLSLHSDVTASTQRSFFTLGGLALSEKWDLTEDLLLGTDPDYGVSMRASYHAQPVYFSLTGRKIWSANNASTNNNHYVFDPLTKTRSAFSSSLTYAFARTSLTLQAQLNKTQNAPVNRVYSLKILRRLYNSREFNTRLEFTGTSTETDRLLLLLTLHVDFYKTKDLTVRADIGRREDHNTEGEDSTGNIAKVDTTWDNRNTIGFGRVSEFSASTDRGRENFSAQYEAITNPYNYRLSARHSHGADASPLSSYSASFNTRFIATPGAFAFAGGRGRNSGVLVRGNGVEKNANIELLDKNRLLGNITDSHSTALLLQPYKQYTLRIQNVGEQSYRYEEKTIPVVIHAGNFQLLQWTLHPSYIVFTRIIKKDGAPLANAMFAGLTSEFSATDEQGYIQMQVSRGQQTLVFKQGKKTCQVTLPDKNGSQAGFVSIDDLVCLSVE